MKTICFLSALLLVFGPNSGKCSCLESGWKAFKDEKCFKVINQFVNRNDADTICRDEVGSNNYIQSPLSVNSVEEQIFLTNWLFQELEIVDAVWLGASRLENNSFSWVDGTNLTYSNWAVNFPTNDSDKECIQMNSNVSKAEGGQWTDVSCIKRNLVVCQKLSLLSQGEMQLILLGTRRELESVQEDLEDVLKNPVPVGFIYVEIPNQPDPQSLWPNVLWQDVTSSYAGLFFRAGGGNAAGFNKIQSENTQRLPQVNYNTYSVSDNLPWYVDVPSSGSWSPTMYSGPYPYGGELGENRCYEDFFGTLPSPEHISDFFRTPPPS